MDNQRDTAYRTCLLCGRQCGVDRSAGGTGFCGEHAEMRIASAGIHRGEEPPITGEGGSGTVFFTGCTLRCVFCQNHQISREGEGRPVSADEFAEICLRLQAEDAGNINLVTGGHFIPSIRDGLLLARARGLRLPVLWNSSGYDYLPALRELHPFIDVYLPDLKTLDAGLAARLFGAPDYPERAREALRFMATERPIEARDGSLVRGLIVRHLILPGYLESTRGVLEWFARNLADRALLSLMTQYTPIAGCPEPAAPDRYVSEQEYEEVLGMLDEYGIEEGFVQDLVVSSDWLPDFRIENPFSSELSRPLWHYLAER